MQTMQYTEGDSEHAPQKGKTFTVEEAVDSIGLGWFQWKIFFVSGLITVSCLSNAKISPRVKYNNISAGSLTWFIFIYLLFIYLFLK